MNRLVIVGNGFDLAHGLPTGYCDFINDFWANLWSRYEAENISSIVYVNPMFYRVFGTEAITCFKDFEKNIQQYCSEYRYNYNGVDKIARGGRGEYIFNFNNDFFKIITNKSSIQNWVDIENEYYQLLKDCLKEKDNSKVKKLNEEFEQVKNLLEEYLQNEINLQYDFNKPNEHFEEISDIFKIRFRYLSDSGENDLYLKEFSKSDHDELIAFDNILIEATKKGKQNDFLNERMIVQDSLFLNFNYTRTISLYNAFLNGADDFGKCSEIQIHGKLNDKHNLINFGFGDEMDDAYKMIEDKDDNEYLRNIKSFQYFQNSNYRDMLDFVDGDKFQVYIMGHSCGLSDRILLNKIFEHHNCRSIKVFYYKNGDWDNYTEIVQNISRHFNKKEMMREKIVNKSLCQPLPQNIRFAKKENGSQS